MFWPGLALSLQQPHEAGFKFFYSCVYSDRAEPTFKGTETTDSHIAFCLSTVYYLPGVLQCGLVPRLFFRGCCSFTQLDAVDRPR